MKYSGFPLTATDTTSPSMRREWIEMILFCILSIRYMSPSMRREWIEMILFCILSIRYMSPSMRREWIEI